LAGYSVTKRQGLIEFFSDNEYYRRLFHLGIPIALQQLIMSF
jgi:hypothetical protein